MVRLKEEYRNTVAPALMNKFGYKSVMQIPKLDKVVINVGCGEAKENSKVIDAIISDLTQITGQKPVRQRNPLQTLSFVRECLLALRLLSVETECMSSSTDCSLQLFRELETSEVSTLTPSMAVVTTPWVSRNS